MRVPASPPTEGLFAAQQRQAPEPLPAVAMARSPGLSPDASVRSSTALRCGTEQRLAFPTQRRWQRGVQCAAAGARSASASRSQRRRRRSKVPPPAGMLVVPGPSGWVRLVLPAAAVRSLRGCAEDLQPRPPVQGYEVSATCDRCDAPWSGASTTVDAVRRWHPSAAVLALSPPLRSLLQARGIACCVASERPSTYAGRQRKPVRGSAALRFHLAR